MLETGRTFATLFADMDLRLRLLVVRSEEEFKRLLWQHTKELAEEQSQMVRRLSTASGLGNPNDVISDVMHNLFIKNYLLV